MTYLKFVEVPQPLSNRIEFAKNNTKLEPNCYGTAFFLLGVLPYDMVIFTGQDIIQKALSRMQTLEDASDNCIMASLINDKLSHLSFIKTASPLIISKKRCATSP